MKNFGKGKEKKIKRKKDNLCKNMKLLFFIILISISWHNLVAQNNDMVPSSGEIPNIQWHIKDSVLYVSGEGDLPDYKQGFILPWNYEVSNIIKVVISGNIKYIGESMFAGYPALRRVEMGSSVEHIGPMAFHANRLLEEIQFSDSLKTIEDLAFANTGLKRVVLPKYTKCEGGPFWGCLSLEYISLPDSIRTTQMTGSEKSFMDFLELVLSPVTDTIASFTIGDADINHLDVPNSVRYIADSAFFFVPTSAYMRQDMRTIYLHFTEQQLQQMNWGPHWAEGLKRDIVTFIVPKGLKNAYEEFINRKYNYNFVIEESDQ
jgi:hypothetical protein